VSVSGGLADLGSRTENCIVGEKRTRYRIDAREFKSGDVILPGENDYVDRLAGYHRSVEELLRATLPDGANVRGKTVHVFEDQAVATEYWLPWAMKDRHLYEVEIDSDDILGLGDMALYNEAAEHPADQARMRQLIDDYCAGKRSPKPKVEVMARKATVTRRLHTAAEGKALFRKKHFPNSSTR